MIAYFCTIPHHRQRLVGGCKALSSGLNSLTHWLTRVTTNTAAEANFAAAVASQVVGIERADDNVIEFSHRYRLRFIESTVLIESFVLLTNAP